MAEDDHLTEYEILREFGLSKNEIYTYLTVISMDLSEAKEICSKTHIPSSKIYNILEKLEDLGLIEIQQSRPKKYRPVALDLALESLRQKKREEYVGFKGKLPKLKEFLQSRIKTYETDAVFWNVTINESEIFNRHISRFRFVDFSSFICIDDNMLEKMATGKMAEEISLNFKKKKITTKLIIGYRSNQEKAKIMDWVRTRPRKIDAKNQIRILKEDIQVPFGLFDLNKVILLMRHPTKPYEDFLLSIYMVNKKLYEDLVPYFDDIWKRGEPILSE